MAETYPIPSHRYHVSIGDEVLVCSGVSGLEAAVNTLDYKDGTGNWFQMPGQPSAANITLKRVISKGRSELYDWFNSTTLNAVEKKDITISLTDESGDVPLVTWNIFDAFPTKLTAPNFDATSGEVAIEEVSLLATRVTVVFA